MTSRLKQVQKVGYGLMNFTWIPSRKISQDDFSKTLKTVLDGCNASASKPLFVNGGEFYGIPDRYENLKLLAGFFTKFPSYADKVYLSIKGGVNAKWGPDTSPKNLEKTFDAIDKYLEPFYAARNEHPKTLDMFCLCRVGTEPIEDTMEIIQSKANEGRFESTCLSEISAGTLERALTVGSVHAIEVEFSLFHREPAENGLFAACHKAGIPAVCYSPLGKGLLAGQQADDLSKDDMRRQFDKFKDEDVIANNKKLVDEMKFIATANKMTLPQLAISWIVAHSNTQRNGFDYPQLIPIPGSVNADRQLGNLKGIELTKETVEKIDNFLKKFKTAGHRYNKALDQMTYR